MEIANLVLVQEFEWKKAKQNAQTQKSASERGEK